MHADGLLVRILANQAALQVIGGDVSAAHATSAEATALAERLGDDTAFIAAAQADAFIAFLDGDFVRMRNVGLAAAARCRETDEIFILPVHLTSAGMGALMLGDHAAAEAALIEALEASLVIDDRPGLVLRMEMLASSAAMAGRAQRAAELLGASEMLRLRIGAQISPFTSPLVAKAEEDSRLRSGTSATRRHSKREHASTRMVPWSWRSGRRSCGLRHRPPREPQIRSASASARSRSSSQKD